MIPQLYFSYLRFIDCRLGYIKTLKMVFAAFFVYRSALRSYAENIQWIAGL